MFITSHLDILQRPDFDYRLSPNELVILTLQHLSGKELAQIASSKSITDFYSRSRKCALYVSAPALKEACQLGPGLVRDAVTKGLKRLHIKFTLDLPDYSYRGYDYTDPEMTELVKGLAQLRSQFPELDFVPCFEVSADKIHRLGPLIAMCSEQRFSNIYLVPPKRRTEKAVLAYRALFEYLRYRGVTQTWISFDYSDTNWKIWNTQTFNSYAGPGIMHFDISNKCTHSCIFCGLYASEAIADIMSRGAEQAHYTRELMKSTLDPQKGREVLQSLPDGVQAIQFGGIGDPMTHPNFMEFVRLTREQGIQCEILSNMDYFTEESIAELTVLGGTPTSSLHFVANISGASEEMYLKTRTRQSSKNYHNVIGTLEKLKQLREKNQGHGVHVTLMCVMTNVNYVEAPEFVQLAKRLGAWQVFLKPVEVHTSFQRKLLPNDKTKKDYALKLQAALNKADELELPIMDRASVESVIAIYSAGQIDQLPKKLTEGPSGNEQQKAVGYE